MTTKQITYWTTLLVLALVVFVDVYMAVHGRQLISGVMLESARKHPIIGVLVGILIGHLFWPQGCP
jgi:uncharacterized membrane protein